MGVDGASALNHQFEEPAGASEHLTDEEVQAIVKRYGERQAGGDTRPTVADVAEALQVEPAVVERLLRDIRTADSQKQLTERLEALEKENSDLRRRAEESESSYEDFYSSSHWRGRSRWCSGRRGSGVFAAMIAGFVAVMLVSAMARSGNFSVAPIFVVAAVAFFIVRVMRRR